MSGFPYPGTLAACSAMPRTVEDDDGAKGDAASAGKGLSRRPLVLPPAKIDKAFLLSHHLGVRPSASRQRRERS